LSGLIRTFYPLHTPPPPPLPFSVFSLPVFTHRRLCTKKGLRTHAYSAVLVLAFLVALLALGLLGRALVHIEAARTTPWPPSSSPSPRGRRPSPARSASRPPKYGSGPQGNSFCVFFLGGEGEGPPCLLLRPVLGLAPPRSVGPFGCACAPLYASEHVKQRSLGQEPTGRQSILTSHLVHRLTPRKQRTHALTRGKQASGGLLDPDTLTGKSSIATLPDCQSWPSFWGLWQASASVPSNRRPPPYVRQGKKVGSPLSESTRMGSHCHCVTLAKNKSSWQSSPRPASCAT
jgi:hypothetical protein